jgi:transcriptional regulator with XRE-family HTH domain
MKTVGAKFKLKRKNLGLTQSKFADLLGIAQGYLSEVESGIKVPSNSLIILFEYISKSQDEERYKKKYEVLVEDYVETLKEVLSLKTQLLTQKIKPSLPLHLKPKIIEG